MCSRLERPSVAAVLCQLPPACTQARLFEETTYALDLYSDLGKWVSFKPITFTLQTGVLSYASMPESLCDKKFNLLKSIRFLKQWLCNLHFIKTWYFSRNVSISCSIHVPCIEKLKIVHNTLLKISAFGIVELFSPVDLYWFFEISIWAIISN